ncbi:dTDP-4-dehydrorhamnose reductase [Weissella confusa]|uniref:dTDP-4-dehydrorhamnose reductase n=1 Tax=Weissella fermenti TaxID=2987699 RepID=A0ABT6D0W9_9LACO|nr:MULTISPECIES: dTDP-4-dehydrorhamnose reductase [Weissella]MBJ7687779.1 dTDP-4-dehydrorhamnose reductase [Weissella confusa]MCW0926692.1 dTDP-4-dehydrorhamnose reductase [Weissella sp. LMG 11983]MDF9299122.1 dTDP-4-dehydrorhamnose reductase [Weissella sp. BK2]
MKYLIVGAKGQLGQELQHLLSNQHVEFVAFDADELDITNREQVFETLQSINPDVVLDAAAYTAVDAAEDEGKELNWLVNAEGTKNLADAVAKIDSILVYVSTDYVFDGTKDGEYLESDVTHPMNEYGKAKLAGEDAVLNSGAKAYIVRTSWVFGEYGNNFVFTMQKLAQKMDKLTVVDDQLGRPTWTKTLAQFMMHLISVDADYGIYHLSNDGEATWYEFAKEILKDEDVVVEPVKSDAFPQKAYRPKKSVMSLEKAKKTGFLISTWQDSLNMFLQK